MLNFFMKRNRKKEKMNENRTLEAGGESEKQLSNNLLENKVELENMFANCSDIYFRELAVGKQHTPCLLIFIQGMVDKDVINKSVMNSLMTCQKEVEQPDIEEIMTACMQIGDVQDFTMFRDMVEAILTGDSVLLIDGNSAGIRLKTSGWPKREVTEPVTEAVVKGPREGFTENINDNTAFLRRKIKTANLKMESFTFGNVTKTTVTISYIEGIAEANLIAEVKSRLGRIKVDSVLESTYIEELIEDAPSTLFPQIENTERPDKVAASLLEGRVAILVDGSPFALVLPVTFTQLLQASEDYYQRYPFATAVRLIRFLFTFLALLLPATYVAVVTYHYEMIPTSLLISIAGTREGVPFPAFIEAVIMEITFEALREAGVRLPRPVGQAVSIVGALVIGQAAVEAGIVSPAMVIVVALTGISSFAIPSYSLAFAIRVLRFIMLSLSAFFGFYGMLLGLLAVLIHLASIRSFGVPYLSPVAPFSMQDMKDVIYRSPWWAMEDRPALTGRNNRRRQKFYLKPRVPKTNKQG